MINDALDGPDGWNMDDDIEDHMARCANKKKYIDSSKDDEENEDDEEVNNLSYSEEQALA